MIQDFLRRAYSLPDGDNDTVVAKSMAGGTVTKGQIQAWSAPLMTTDSPIVNVCIQMIYHYVNTQAGLIGEGQPLKAIPNVFNRNHKFYNLVFLPGGHILAAMNLRDSGITPSIFLQIQYFLVPMNPNGHWSLVVISPRDRTVEILDSFRVQFDNWERRSWRHVAENIYIEVFHLLEYFLGRLFTPAQWRTMDNQSSQQEDSLSCGLYVCRFAMSIACREPLYPDTYRNQNDWLERARIGIGVLHGSFTGIFIIFLAKIDILLTCIFK